MKRITGLLAAPVAAALSLSLAACSAQTPAETAPSGTDGSSAAAPVDITYWLWQDNATDTTWQELADTFNASQSEAKVTLEVIPLDQYQNQLVTSILNGTGPDAARSKDWWLGQFAPDGALADLTPYIDSWAGKSDMVESLWDTGRLPGKSEVYMLPHQFTTLYLYYRKDVFEAAGLKAPTTQEELLAAAKALTNGDGQYGIDVRGGGGGQDQWLAWMYAGGADVVDASGAVVLDNATAVGVNQKYLDLVGQGSTPPGSITAAFADVKTNFASGVTTMMIHHAGSLTEMRDTFGDNLGVVPIPTADGQTGATLGAMSGNVILSGSEKKDAAWKWLSWLSEPDQMATISDSAQGQLPVLTSTLARDKYQADEGLAVATGAATTARTWPALAGVAQLAGKDWQPTIQAAFQGQKTSQEALTEMAEVLNSGA